MFVSLSLYCGGPMEGFRRWMDAASHAKCWSIELRDVAALSDARSLEGTELWFEPQANYALVYQMRDRCSRYAYPIVSTVHGISIHAMLFDQFTRVLLCDTYAADCFVSSSAAAKRALEKLLQSVSDSLEQRYGLKRRFAGKHHVIPLRIDTDLLRPGNKSTAKRKLKLPRDSTFLLYFGFVSTLKADLLPCLLALAEAPRALKEQNIIFGVAGGGEDDYRRTLIEYARATGFPASRLRIYKDPSEDLKHTLFVAADIFTSPAENVQEAFGLTVVEAMAFGVPQVVANWSGYRVRQEYNDLLLDLAATSPPARRCASPLQIESPHYYDWFGHFASYDVTGCTMLRSARCEKRNEILRAAVSVRQSVRPDIVEAICAVVETSGPTSMTDTVAALSGRVSKDTALRHVMWCLKHGLLRADSPLVVP